MKRYDQMKKSQAKLYCLTLLLALFGCQTAPDKPTEIINALDAAIKESSKPEPKALKNVPNVIQQELMQRSISQARQGLLAEKRLEISASDVSAREFFAALVDESPYSVVVHPDVTGTITLNLKNSTLHEVLDVVEEVYGYEIRSRGKVVQVYPAGIRTETIPLNYLYVKRSGMSSMNINSGGVSESGQNNGNNSSSNSNNSNSSSNSSSSNNNNQNNQQGSGGVNIYTETQSDFWTELKETLTLLVGSEKGRSVIVSPQAGLVTVRALPEEIKAIKSFIKDTETHLRRQVIIEAKIMEVTLNDDYQQGVKWDKVLGSIGSSDLTFSTAGGIAGNIISGTIGGTSSLAFNNDDFSGVIDLLSTQGNVQVLSSPRITATNNQKAVIKVGEDEYFVTDISSTTTTGTSTTTTPEIDLTPFFSGIALDVTAQIAENDEVILHVHPSVTLTNEQIKVIKIDGEEVVLPLAQSSVRESDTIIRAKSGEIVVIGGLIETRKVDIESKTPLLGDIPFLGELFKSKSETTQKKELVIMLKPIVVGQDTWKNQLQDARSLLKQWFPEEDDFSQSEKDKYTAPSTNEE
jgi:MSHA biogenesis protein MshL